MEYLLLGRSRSGVGVGVGVEIFSPESELESESLKIRRLRSPVHRQLVAANLTYFLMLWVHGTQISERY